MADEVAPVPLPAPAPQRPAQGPRVGINAILTLVLFAVTVYGWVQLVVTHYETGLVATQEALRHVDIMAVVDGFVAGIAAVPIGSDGWMTPWDQLAGGVGGMWHVMVAGGWSAIAAGIVTLLGGLAIFAGTLNLLDENATPPPPVRWLARIVALGFVLITVVALGLGLESLARPLYADVPALAVVTGGFDDLSDGFTQARAHGPAAALEGSAVRSFVADFVATHAAFTAITVVVGMVAAAAVGVAAAAFDAGFLALALLPFVGVAVVIAGAGIASVAGHLLAVYAIAGLIKFATFSIYPAFFGTAVMVLDKGHLGLELFEVGRKMLGRVK